jgi:hypothetical protein
MVPGNIKNEVRVVMRDDVERFVELIEVSIPVHSNKSHVCEPSGPMSSLRVNYVTLRCC